MQGDLGLDQLDNFQRVLVLIRRRSAFAGVVDGKENAADAAPAHLGDVDLPVGIVFAQVEGTGREAVRRIAMQIDHVRPGQQFFGSHFGGSLFSQGRLAARSAGSGGNEGPFAAGQLHAPF